MLAPCVNRTCPHPDAVHDIYEPGDPYPTCCAEGCGCGKPGEVMLRRLGDGTVEVLAAPPVIRVSREFLNQAADLAWDGETLTLDAAGEHRYVYLRPDPVSERVLILGRVKP